MGKKAVMGNLVIACVAALTCGAMQVEATPHDSIRRLAAMQQKEKLPSIKVLVVHNADSAVVEVKGKYQIFDPYKGSRLADRFSGKRNLMQPLADGLKWGEEFPGIFQLQIVPENSQVTTLVDGFEYRGSLYIYDVGGHISIVNELPVEDYLCSVMTSQIEGTHSDEALAATAITARTNAYHQIQMAKNPFWHVEAEDVGYLGYGVTCRYNGIEEAINTTKHMVMSQGSPESGEIVTFPTQVIQAGISSSKPNKRTVAVLSLEQAEKMAKSGNDAAQILAKVFPHTRIQLIYQPVKLAKVPVTLLSDIVK